MSDRIVFLDFDGVVIPSKSIAEALGNAKRFIKGERVFDKACTDRLNLILQKSEADLVICSGWRKEDRIRANMVQVLIENGVKIDSQRYLGVTPEDSSRQRGWEIQIWINKHQFDGKFVILDDESDMSPLMSFLVNTNPGVGLTDKDVAEALQILGI